MKLLLSTGIFFFALFANAQTSRWIVMNPHRPIGSMFGGSAQTLRSFQLNHKTFKIVQTRDSHFSMATMGKTKMALAAFIDADDVEPDFPIGLEAAVTPPTQQGTSSSSPWEAWQVDSLHYDKLPAAYDGRGVVIALLDTGIEYTHPALKDHIWVNPQDGQTHGYNVVNHNSDPMDKDVHSHGTHCAGIIGASNAPKGNAQGVAPGAKIMAVRVMEPRTDGFISDAAGGIIWAVDHGAQILSGSWRVYKSWKSFKPTEQNTALLKEAISYAASKGVIFVTSAGNESNNLNEVEKTDPIFPAGYTGLNNMVVVTASAQDGTPAWFSNTGNLYVQLAAPGVEILSTVRHGQWSWDSGASMATPIIAGAIARGISKGFSPEQAVRRLIETSDDGGTGWAGLIAAKGPVNLMKYLAP